MYLKVTKRDFNFDDFSFRNLKFWRTFEIDAEFENKYRST